MEVYFHHEIKIQTYRPIQTLFSQNCELIPLGPYIQYMDTGTIFIILAAAKELSIQVKQTIARLQKQNKSIREIAGTLGVAKTTVWYILSKKNALWAQKHK